MIADHEVTCDLMQKIEYGFSGGRVYLRHPWKLMTVKCTCGYDVGFWRDAGHGVEQWVVPR